MKGGNGEIIGGTSVIFSTIMIFFFKEVTIQRSEGILQVESVEFSVGLGTGRGVGEREKPRMP